VTPHVLLLTSAPGVGKTTVVRKVAERLGSGSRAGPTRVAGFYTEETRHRAGHRTGFRAVSFGGGRARSITDIGRPGPPRGGKYGVDIAAVDALAEETLALDDEVDLYLIDEIGKMECLSERFVEAVERLLESDKPVVATIGKRGGGLIASAKRRPDAELWDVTTANRDPIPDRVLDWLSPALG
jgi:nucleoside-triphosphatase